LRGEEPFGNTLPIGKRLEDHFLQQVRELNSKAQLFLLVAAAESSGDPSLVRRAAFELGSDAQAEDAAVASGLIALRPRVEFRHPLIRAAVYGGGPRAMRDEVHRTLAAILDRTDPDRRVRHLAAAARGPDTELALELEEAALRAARRGGYAAEASFLLEAAHLSPAPDVRARRLLNAAQASLNAGLPQRAEALLEQAFPGLHDPLLRAEAMLLDGTLRTPLADPPSAPARLVAAAEALAPLDLELARNAFLEALTACAVAHRFTAGTTTEDVAGAALATIKGPGSGETLGGALLEGAALFFAADYGGAMPILHKAAAALRAGAVTREEVSHWYLIVLNLTNELVDDETYNSWVALAERQARADGALIVLQVVLLGRAKAELRAGRFKAAEMTYEEVVDITRAVGGPPEFYEMLKCDLYAWRGQEHETRASAAPLREAAAAIGSAAAVGVADLAIATLELGAGRYAAALRVVAPMADDNLPGWTCLALPIAVEAAARSGAVERARGYLAALRSRTAGSDATWARGQLARCSALLADDSEAEALFLEAVRLLESTSVTTEANQAKLAYGEWLRRQNRRVDARAQLRAAFDWFSDVGAESFATRARAELEATGERVTSRSADIRTGLTSQETQAARLAAGGATNAEIASQMYISTNTVDYHLRKVYRKLGIASRRELRTAVPAIGF